ncbi:hypothetical protein BKA70DRAFT_1572877 [Coprinopsis sp. MPI-PUGE-AT-0042]|nr:hypothetical protein BKA70DRAFT_1572877 [Coprinopsis sp. MPI-PUGE-AT-0042]
MEPGEQAALGLSIAGPCVIAAILCVTLIRWFMALRRNSVIQQRPPTLRLPEASAPNETRRDSRASSFFDSKAPIDIDEDPDPHSRFGGPPRALASKGIKTGGKKAIPTVDIDIELATVADNSNNNPYMGHYNLKRPRPTTTTTHLDFSKRLDVDIGKSSLSLPTLEYSPRGG